MPREMPKRLSPPAPYGALLKGASDLPQRRALKAETKGGDQEPDYRALIQRLPCLSCGVEPCGECAHVRFASGAFGKASGLGKKPDWKWCLPLCRDDHLNAKDAQHKQNERAFWEGLGIEPLPLCVALWSKRFDFVAMLYTVQVAIAERDRKEGDLRTMASGE